MNTHSPLLIVFLLLATWTTSATNYFVAPTGNDSNNGLSLANAFQTLQHASNQVTAGDTVFVADGNYPVGFDHRSPSGTASQPIVFKTLGTNAAITGKGPIRNDGINIENADFIVIDGFRVIQMPFPGNGIRLVNADNCVVRNTFCDGNGERGIFTAFTDDILIEHNICTNSMDEHGIYVSNSSDRAIIRYNECFGNNNIGIHLNGDLSAGGDGIMSDIQVYGNILHDNNQAAGINMDGLKNPIVYNNIIYNNHNAQGIALFQGDGAIPTNGAKIFNNTIVVPTDGRWGIHLKDGCNENTEIYNNIVINQHSFRGCITVENTNNFKSDFNIVNDKMSASGDGSRISLASWQALGFDQNSQLATNLTDIFVNPNSNDFHLKNGSQAIDKGTDLVSNLVKIDIERNLRSIGMGYDIGAYEQQDCPQDLNLVMNLANGTMVKTAATSITANNTISGTANLTYAAGNSILLSSGFTVNTTNGAQFHAFIQGCTPNSLQPTPPSTFQQQLTVHQPPNVEQLQFQVQPNPVQQTAQIKFYLPTEQLGQLILFDANGRLIKVLQNGVLPSGWHQIDWNRAELSNGVYHLLLQGEKERKSQKIHVIR